MEKDRDLGLGQEGSIKVREHLRQQTFLAPWPAAWEGCGS
jgi:hypothetical protein